MKNRVKAFTLAELLIVMGIIVLFVTLSIPALRAMTGSRSINLATNQLAALITRAREEAVGVQAVRGVLFFVDPASNRVVGVICQLASVQDNVNPGFAQQNVLLLDAVPNRDSLMLPQGVRLQTVYSSSNPGANGNRYLGYNPINGGAINVGGCVLFDGNGRLIVQPYGFQMAQLSGVPPTATMSNLGQMFFGTSTLLTSLSGGIAGGTNSYSYISMNSGAPTAQSNLPLSQVGFVLFDTEAFNAQGFVDADTDPLETTKQAWIDSNSTPVLVTRADGTLIRGE